jgi:hypothetical protein
MLMRPIELIRELREKRKAFKELIRGMYHLLLISR